MLGLAWKWQARGLLLWPELSLTTPRPCAVVIVLAGSCQAFCAIPRSPAQKGSRTPRARPPPKIRCRPWVSC